MTCKCKIENRKMKLIKILSIKNQKKYLVTLCKQSDWRTSQCPPLRYNVMNEKKPGV